MKKSFQLVANCCPPKPRLAERALLSSTRAKELAGVFKILSNDTRLRLLHALDRAGEMCVTDLAGAVSMKPQAVSNQLQRLVDRRILVSLRRGNNVYYRILDPCVSVLLDRGWCLILLRRRVSCYAIGSRIRDGLMYLLPRAGKDRTHLLRRIANGDHEVERLSDEFRHALTPMT